MLTWKAQYKNRVRDFLNFVEEPWIDQWSCASLWIGRHMNIMESDASVESYFGGHYLAQGYVYVSLILYVFVKGYWFMMIMNSE